MDRLPAPPADRRRLPDAKKKKELTETMSGLMLRQIDQLRTSIRNFTILPTRINTKLDYSVLPGSINLLLFGPAGSGKSSLIKSFYHALHSSTQLPSEVRHKIVVKGTAQNEGTTLFSTVTLKEESEVSGIKVHDTRGQIWMDPREQAQAELIIQGKVKDLSRVEQRSHRYAYLLWEFWRDRNHLFPTEIMKNKPSLTDKPHCLLFVFDGSMEEIPNGEEETQFYKEVMQLARSRGYFYPQIILTHIDQLERKISSEDQLRQALDMKIESVVMKLGDSWRASTSGIGAAMRAASSVSRASKAASSVAWAGVGALRFGGGASALRSAASSAIELKNAKKP